MVIPRTHGNIADMASTTARATKEDNRRCLARIIESLQYLARQGIAIKADDNKESNFEMRSTTARATGEDNRRWLAKIIESLQYLPRQVVAIRAYDNTESNFIQLLKLRAKDDEDLANWLSSKGDKYDIQYELIGIMANQVVRNLVVEIKKNNYFSLICDEYTDIYNKELLTFYLCWIDKNLKAHEDSIGFFQISNNEADTITAAINTITASFK